MLDSAQIKDEAKQLPTDIMISDLSQALYQTCVKLANLFLGRKQLSDGYPIQDPIIFGNTQSNFVSPNHWVSGISAKQLFCMMCL